MTTLEVRPVSTADVVAANIRAEAARQGVRQQDMADALGIAQTAISKRWRGVRAWQLDELDTVARLLGLEVEDLVRPTGREPWCPRRDSNSQPTDYWPTGDEGDSWDVAA